jgi:hypothetical protein
MLKQVKVGEKISSRPSALQGAITVMKIQK